MKLDAWTLNLPDDVAATMAALLRALEQQQVVDRLWARDASLWHPSSETQAGIARRLGWLDAPRGGDVADARTVAATLERPLLLVAPGEAGAAARLWLRENGTANGIELLDSWAPAAVRETLGRTWSQIVWAADRSSPVLGALRAALAAAESRARIAAVAPASISGSLGHPSPVLAAPEDVAARWGALESYGLLAAALAGRDLDAIAGAARAAIEACHATSAANPGVRLGAALAALAQHGYDLLVIASGPEPRLAEWIAGLLAGSLAKHGRGFVPIVEPAAAPERPCGRDIVRIELRAPRADSAPEAPPGRSGGAVAPAAPSGGPEPAAPGMLVELAGDGAIAAQVVIWQVAVAVAAVVLGVNPFDQPDTIEIERRMEQAAAAGKSGFSANRSTTGWRNVRWIALAPYFALDTRVAAALQRLRAALERRTGKPVLLIEPLRHGWATQLMHAGRPRGFVLAIAPLPEDDLPLPGLGWSLHDLVVARLSLDVAAWSRMGRWNWVLTPGAGHDLVAALQAVADVYDAKAQGGG